uniref:Transmembrane protein n=1 Tax=Plectus sambesii TaxID=2011161 RepID=A0A914UHF9_9BILA
MAALFSKPVYDTITWPKVCHDSIKDYVHGAPAYLLPPPPVTRTGLYICRILTVIGLLLLLTGAVGIVIGYTWPHERLEETMDKVAVYQDEDGSYYLPRASLDQLLRDPMRHWKLSGLAVFATGGVLLALSLLIPTCAQCIGSKRLAGFASERDTPNEPPIRIFPASAARTNEPAKYCVSPAKQTSPGSGGPVPAMEEITSVQPQQEVKQRTTSSSADEMLLAEGETQ